MKSLNVILSLAVFILLGIAAVEHQPNDKFKNLQVLPKDITEDSLDKIMDRFTVDLGVDCKYCHERDKKADSLIFESDNKPEKEIARKMMLMTADLNKNYFQFNEEVNAAQVQAVTCFTCHKGTQIPEKEKKVVKNSPFSIQRN
ncbi:MAG: c-type cytochrome [Chitinophagaceae bacterium]|nr:c-type cytochrome [Chitinophagaceae bacterium]